MQYDFNSIINRKNTSSIKYDFAAERGMPEGVLPLWVADMDFQAPPEVIEELMKTARHGIFGYSESKRDYFEALQHWYRSRFQWDIQYEWLVKTPGVVFALAAAIRAFTEKGDAVMIQKPVYYPFFQTIEANRRLVVNSPLVYENGTYHIDFDDFESKIKKHKVKMFILCSPHNPVGRVWSREELIRVGDICLENGVLVVSDEIHADFVYKGYKHAIFSSVRPEYSDNTVLLTAPSKSFNLAGLQVSNVFIANRDLRKSFREEIKRTGYSQLNIMGLVACRAAYQHGARWMDALLEYLEGNLEFSRSFLQERLPQIQLVEPQGTYLLWLNLQSLKLSEEEQQNLIVGKANLWLDSGLMFGTEGKGFERMNIACPRSILDKAFQQLELAVKSLYTSYENLETR